MKRIWYILLFLGSFQPLISITYIESLDGLIEQRIKAITNESLLDVVAISQQVNNSIDTQITLQAVYELLQSKKFISFFLLDSSVITHEIKFALGAKIYLYCLDCCERKMLHKSLKNYDSLDYWQHEQFYESRDLLHKNIIRLVNDDSYKKEIQNNITHLEQIIEQTTSFLGLIRYNKQMLLQAVNREVFEKNLMMAVRLQDIQLNNVERDYDVCDIYGVLITAIEQFHSLSAHLSAQYIECQPPQYFERNWVACTLTAAGIGACAVAYYIYKDDVDTCADLACKAGSALWQDKVKSPLKKIINTLSGAQNEPFLDSTRDKNILENLYRQGDQAPNPLGSDVTTGAALADNSLQLAGQAANHVALQAINSFWSLFGYENQAQEEKSQAQVEPINQKNDQNISPDQKRFVDEKDGIILAHINKNVGQAPQAFLRSIFGSIVEGKQAVNELYEEHQLMLGVAALFPVMAIAVGAVSATNRAYHAASYQYVRRVIRDLEIFLNDSVVKPISFDREGKLYFLTELLKKKCDVLTMNEHKLMEEDIAELQSKNLTYLQKFNIVQRMYHTYAFLLPGAN